MFLWCLGILLAEGNLYYLFCNYNYIVYCFSKYIFVLVHTGPTTRLHVVIYYWLVMVDYIIVLRYKRQTHIYYVTALPNVNYSAAAPRYSCVLWTDFKNGGCSIFDCMFSYFFCVCYLCLSDYSKMPRPNQVFLSDGYTSYDPIGPIGIKSRSDDAFPGWLRTSPKFHRDA